MIQSYKRQNVSRQNLEKDNAYKIFHCVCYTHSKSTHDDSQSKSSEQDSIYWQLESNKHPQEKYVGSPLVKCCVEGIYSQSTLLISEGKEERQNNLIFYSFFLFSYNSEVKAFKFRGLLNTIWKKIFFSLKGKVLLIKKGQNQYIKLQSFWLLNAFWVPSDINSEHTKCRYSFLSPW